MCPVLGKCLPARAVCETRRWSWHTNPGQVSPLLTWGEEKPLRNLLNPSWRCRGDVWAEALGKGWGCSACAFHMQREGRGDGKGKWNRSYLLLRDVKLISLQNHITVFPDFPKNAFPTKFPHPADLLWLHRLLVSILLPLTQREREENGGKLLLFLVLHSSSPPLPLCPTFASPSLWPLSPPKLGPRYFAWFTLHRFFCCRYEATTVIPRGRCKNRKQGFHSVHYIRKAVMLHSPHTTCICLWKEEQEAVGENLN